MAAEPGAFTTVASCLPDTNACATAGLVFTLSARPAGAEAGRHTLTATWRIEALE